MSLAALETPAAVVDLDALVANIDGVLAAVRAATPPGHTVRVRPHAKSHKCAQLALLQAQRSGGLTTGVCAQKVREAEALVRGGVVDVLLSNEVVDGRKLARLAGLAAGGATIRVLVDDADNAAAVSRAAVAARTTLGVLVEVDVGQRRCGVTGPAEAVALAAVIANLPGVRLDGIQCYHGAAQHVRSVAGRRAMVDGVAAIARATVAALGAAGLPCPIVTGGGTGTFALDAATGAFTEVQPGSYVFSDADYARNERGDGAEDMGTLWAPALFLATTVMSVRDGGDGGRWAVVDSGLKAQSTDSGLPVVVATAREYAARAAAASATAAAGGAWSPPVAWSAALGRFDSAGATWTPAGVSDEHTTLVPVAGAAGPHSATGSAPPLGRGDVLLLMPGHCDPFVNHYDELVLVRGGEVVGAWPVDGRGPGL